MCKPQKSQRKITSGSLLQKNSLQKAKKTSGPKDKLFLYYKIYISLPMETEEGETASCFLSVKRRHFLQLDSTSLVTFVSTSALQPCFSTRNEKHLVLKCQGVWQLGHLPRTCKLWIQTFSGGKGLAQMYP